MISSVNVRRAAAALVAVLLAFVFSVSLAYAATNLVSNPGFEAPNNSQESWAFLGYDDNGNFATLASSSIVAGPTGSAANITLSGALNGDAKWVHDTIAIEEQGALYTFSDSYKSTAPTSLVAALSGGSNPDVYMQLGTLPSTAGEWKEVSLNFTPLLGYTTVTVYHTISAAGSLTTDNYSLTEVASSSQNLFSQGIVSLTFDDGWTSQYLNAFPLMDGLKATFYMVGKALRGASIHDLFEDPAATAEMVPVVNENDVTWAPIYTDPTVTVYEFTDTYSASTTSTVEITYTTGGTPTTIPSPVFEAGENKVAQFAVVIPNTIDPGITVTHKSAGALSVSNPSLASDLTGYMTPAMMQEIQAAGNEIGGHTESHCNLVRLFTGEPSTSTDTCAFPEAGLTWQNEVTTGRSSVINFGGSNVVNFAYPNGANNQAIRDYIKNSTGYVSARTVDDGYNTQQSDKMALKVQVVDVDISIEKIKSWIDTAVANKLWLILVFHQVDNPAAPTSNGEDGGTTTTIFSQIVDYLKTKDAGTVKTVAEALAMMTATPIPPADTTAPVIAAHADVYAVATSTNTSTTVSYTNPTATDNVDASVTVTCTPASGSIFNLGTTTVTCQASDLAGNPAVPESFDVIVTAAPEVDPTPSLSAEQKGAVTDTSVTITWTTNHPATSRVVWGTASVPSPVASSTMATGTDLYGYQNTTVENSTLVTSHSVTVSGLSANTTYYFRPVSHGSPEAFGNEVVATTNTTPAPPAPPVSSGGGGGGGGGGIIGPGPLSIGYVNTNPTGPVVTTPGSVLGAATNCFIFTQALMQGSTGAEVTALQNRLTTEGLFSATATGFFGPITKTSVMAYQAKNSIMTTGTVGPLTRAALNAGCVAPATPAAPAVLGAETMLFTQTLTVGSTGAQVTALQKILIDLGFLKVAAPTGYFGALTKAAVVEYQVSRGLPGVGIVGPLTRAALNGNAAAVSSEK